MSFVKVQISGNLTRKPELRFTPTGQAVCDFTIASNRRYTTSGGEKREETTFIRVTTWGKLAENCAKYLDKGREATAFGNQLSASAYTNKQNEPAASLELTANEVHFHGGAMGGGDGEDDGDGAPAPRQSNRRSNSGDAPEQSNDIPF
jgi:single-strand DNA-binding protein